ncbi:hypothetical protein [Mycobacterium gastri]|uniref:Uncharacterized protein n=1 Tax=Mycobacterium gastri TaxID=1777 RepID=A0A1X1V1R9_MYCGS|nr:hypothetical protein [Mycobacterium gastri]ETW24396.1 hypothetical protein MGAST_08700 [Mycobacterium gastri 'Wayne']ORV62977.1 hypothetical protein AWC07_16675 [Mycobacterium gastri]
MDIGRLVTRYARRFSRVHAGVHPVSSPLGAWLLLALAAPVARDHTEAAAATSVALRSAMVSSALSRSATLRFGHPYAVVAVTGARRRGDPWAGVPVFAAWVCEPADVASIG